MDTEQNGKDISDEKKSTWRGVEEKKREKKRKMMNKR